ncbi:MAG: deoxyhypusine synthase [Spirochaetes bacterium]|nr:deoxyhypusine synthase [Spirochaetota bacterium]
MNRTEKNTLLAQPVGHVDITSFDARRIIDAMGEMSFTAREVASAEELFQKMIRDTDCTIILTLAGSAGAGGCLRVYHDMIKYNMVDVIVASGATVVDMDFFEALGFRHYRADRGCDDRKLRLLRIERIHDTLIDGEELQVCAATIKSIADSLEPGPRSSREFISRLGGYLVKSAKKRESLVQAAHENGVPVFCPTFSDSRAGLGLALHRQGMPDGCVLIDSVKDLDELARIMMKASSSGLFMIGGGIPEQAGMNMPACCEFLHAESRPHRYAVRVMDTDPAGGGPFESVMRESFQGGRGDVQQVQTAHAAATLVLPLIASSVYHRGDWKKRPRRNWAALFSPGG